MKPTPEQVASLIALIKAKQSAEDEFVRRHGHARFPVYTHMNGKMVLAIGGTMNKQTREGPYNLLDAYHDTALDLFGEGGIQAEMTRPFEERHHALQWLSAAVDQHKTEGMYMPSGSSVAWGRLGYDLFTVRDNAKLLAKLSRELRNPDDFQSARCELLTCSTAVTAGFEIQFEDEADTDKRHVEFVAVHMEGGVAISVEAKSRRRNGVLGFKGGHAGDPGSKVKIRSLVENALGKAPAHPLYVFIDVNLPAGTKEERLRWIAEIQQSMQDLHTEGYLQDSLLHGVLFMNDPSHYIGPRHLGTQTDSLWAYPVKLRDLKLPDSGDDVMDRLLLAWKQRNDPPSMGPGG